jgi:hypothetical protein
VDWPARALEKQRRYRRTFGEQDERSLVRRGNAAYAAGLSLAMAYDPAAAEWFGRAASRWRESWDAGAAADSWGRPVGVLKASLLAGDEGGVALLSGWTLGLGTVGAPSPIGRYAAVLALLATGRFERASPLAMTLSGRDDFPADVASSLAAIAAGVEPRYREAVVSVVRSFESRDEFLEDVPVADTALVLAELARRRGFAATLPPSPTLP